MRTNARQAYSPTITDCGRNAFNSAQVSRQFYDSNDMSNNRTTEQQNNRTTEQEVRFAAYEEVRGCIGAQKNKSEAISEEALDAYNGTK